MAQKNLTRLNVALTMTTGAFQRSTQSAISAAASMGERMKGAILGPIGLVTSALSAGAFVASVRAAAQRIDELAKSADRLGISTQSLAGFRLAADQTGVAVDAMEQAMGKLQVTVAKAAGGSKEAAAALSAVGLSAAQLANLSVDQQMARVADGINALGSSSQRAAASVALFGESGGKLQGLLALGSGGLEKAARDAEAMGLALSRVDAAKVEEANQSLGRISKLIEGAMNAAAVQFSPIVTMIANDFQKAATNAGGFGRIMENVVSVGVNVVGFLANSWAGLEIVFRSVRIGVWTLAQGFVDAGNILVADAQRIGMFFGRAWDFIRDSGEALWAALRAGWSAAKVPIADFVQFAGSQIAALLRTMAEATMRFDVQAGTAILNAANKVQVSIGSMGADARIELDKNLAGVSTATAKAGASFSAMFDDYRVSGSEALSDLSASMQAVIEEDMAAIEDMVNSSTPWQQLEDRVAYEKAAAETRAQARANEVAAAQAHSSQMFEIEDQGLQQMRFGWYEHYNWLQNSGANNTRQALSASSTFFGNLAALQQSHNKRAKAIGEAAAKAKIVTDTAQAAMAAYASLAGIPIVGPALGAAAAAAAVAAGAVQLSNVGKDSIGGGAPGLGSVGDTGSSLSQQASRPSQTLVLQGEMFSADSLARIFEQAKEQGYVIEGVRRA